MEIDFDGKRVAFDDTWKIAGVTYSTSDTDDWHVVDFEWSDDGTTITIDIEDPNARRTWGGSHWSSAAWGYR